MFYFGKNDYKIIAKCRCGAGGNVLASQPVDSGALIGIQGKPRSNFGLLTSGGQKNS